MAKISYAVIRDSREKEGMGWWFSKDDYCQGTVCRKLDTADYSIENFETKFAIDRKGQVSEFATNLSDPRFYRELERFDTFKRGWIFNEFYLDDIMIWPATSGIPKRQLQYVKTTPKYLIMKLNEIQVKFNVSVLFVGSYGKEVASSMFKRWVEHG